VPGRYVGGVNGGIEFELAGVPVKVLWMFFIVTVLLGYGLGDPLLIAMWIGVVFVSILIHEFGHAMAYRRFGVQPSVVLHGFGGLTFGRSLPVRQDLAVSLAGPAAGLAVGLPALYAFTKMPFISPVVDQLLWMVVFVNVFWSVLNLVPMLPLDGGNATNAVLTLVFRRDMTRPTRVLSLICAAVLIGVALKYRFVYGAFLAAWYAYMNFQGLQQGGSLGRFAPTVTRPPKVSRPGRKAPGRTPPAATPPPPAWSPTAPDRPPTAPVSTVGWVQPGAHRRTFAHEVDTATQALSRAQPELASIAVGRAQRLAVTDDDHRVVEQLRVEVERRLGS
jgi:Zn-dependent protease